MATNTAARAMSYSAPVCASRTRTPVTRCRPFTASTSVQSKTETLGCARIRAATAFDARSRGRWLMRVTRRASGSKKQSLLDGSLAAADDGDLASGKLLTVALGTVTDSVA